MDDGMRGLPSAALYQVDRFRQLFRLHRLIGL